MDQADLNDLQLRHPSPEKVASIREHGGVLECIIAILHSHKIEGRVIQEVEDNISHYLIGDDDETSYTT